MGFLRNKIALSVTGLLFLAILIGMAHNRALDSGQPSHIQDLVRTLLYPVNTVSHAVFSLSEQVTQALRPRSSILRENRNIRREVRAMARETAVLREAAAEGARIRQELNLRNSIDLKMIAAEVVSRKESSWFDTAIVNRGTNAGVEPGAAVINHWGLIGQVLEADRFSSQMVALTDVNSAVGAMVQRSRSSGILQGQGADYVVLTYLPKDADVKDSDIVVSSGMGGVIPKGLVIGRVIRVVRNSTAGTTSALVRPSVRFDQVEQVFVVKPGQGLAP